MIAGTTVIRGLLRLTLLAVLSWQASSHSIQNTHGKNPPTYEELTTSLVLNQLAIMQLMYDSSNASCAAVEMRREGDAVREEVERLEEALGAQVDRVQATMEARQRQQMQQLFDALNRTAVDTLTKIEELRQEMREELANAVLEAQTPTTPATEVTQQPTAEDVPELAEYLGEILHNDHLPSMCSGNKTLHGTVGALEVKSSGSYSDNTLCSWNLNFPMESTVSLTWEYIDMETTTSCAYDWVTVLDVTRSQLVYGRKLCAKNPSSSILQLLNVSVPGTRNLLVTFRSDGSNVGRGFRMLYHAHGRSRR